MVPGPPPVPVVPSVIVPLLSRAVASVPVMVSVTPALIASVAAGSEIETESTLMFTPMLDV